MIVTHCCENSLNAGLYLSKWQHAQPNVANKCSWALLENILFVMSTCNLLAKAMLVWPSDVSGIKVMGINGMGNKVYVQCVSTVMQQFIH